jgi:hypothetical protein
MLPKVFEAFEAFEAFRHGGWMELRVEISWGWWAKIESQAVWPSLWVGVGLHYCQKWVLLLMKNEFTSSIKTQESKPLPLRLLGALRAVIFGVE